jgi:hypothetical protein
LGLGYHAPSLPIGAYGVSEIRDYDILRIMTKRFSAEISAVALLVTAAAAQPATGRVYVYDLTPAVRSNPVWCDGVKTAQLRKNRFFGLNLAAGEHSFSGRHRSEQIILDVEAGKTYYLRLDQIIAYPIVYDKLTRQRAEEAGQIVNTLGAIDPRDIFDSQHVTLERPQ